MDKKIIIIGGGIAGMTAGIYSRLNGFETEIIEMHKLPGGQCTAWDRKGFRFDYCLHWLVGTSRGAFHEIWKDTRVLTGLTSVLDHEVYVKMANSRGEEFYVYADIDRWEKYLLQLAPEDNKAIKQMCREMRKGKLLMPFNNPPELLGVFDYIKALYNMFPTLLMMMKYKDLNCDEYFKKLGFKNRILTEFLNGFYVGRDFSALTFLLMLAFFNQKNAGYIIGGSKPLSDRMAERFTTLGGKFNFGLKVVKILVENGRSMGVELEDGSKLSADYVISAADGHATLYDMLEGRFLTDELKNAYENWNLFEPLVQVSFGINQLIQANVPVTAYLDNEQNIGSTNLKYGYNIMNYGFDPTLAPEGKSVIMIRFESPWNMWEKMDKDSYKIEKQMILEDSLKIMEKHYPDFAAMVEVSDVATPLTDFRYTGVWKGSYEGFMPSAKNFNKNLKMTLPGLDNFYMAGQWLFPGGGLPPSAQSGRWAVQMICKKEKRNFVTFRK